MGSFTSLTGIQRGQEFNVVHLGKTLKKGLQRERHLGRSMMAIPGWQYQLELSVCPRGLRPALYAERGSPFSEPPLTRRVRLLRRNRDVWVCPPSRQGFLNLTEQ